MEPSQLLHELNRFLLRNDDASVPQFEESFGSIIDQIEKLKSHQLFIGITDWNLVCTVPINLTVYVQTITTNSNLFKYAVRLCRYLGQYSIMRVLLSRQSSFLRTLFEWSNHFQLLSTQQLKDLLQAIADFTSGFIDFKVYSLPEVVTNIVSIMNTNKSNIIVAHCTRILLNLSRVHESNDILCIIRASTRLTSFYGLLASSGGITGEEFYYRFKGIEEQEQCPQMWFMNISTAIAAFDSFSLGRIYNFLNDLDVAISTNMLKVTHENLLNLIEIFHGSLIENSTNWYKTWSNELECFAYFLEICGLIERNNLKIPSEVLQQLVHISLKGLYIPQAISPAINLLVCIHKNLDAETIESDNIIELKKLIIDKILTVIPDFLIVHLKKRDEYVCPILWARNLGSFVKLLHYFNQINIREYKKRVLDVIRLNSLEDRIWNLFRGFEIAAIIPNGNNVAIGLCKYYFIISEESIENKYEKLIDSQIYQLIADSNKPFDIFSNQIIDFELPEEANTTSNGSISDEKIDSLTLNSQNDIMELSSRLMNTDVPPSALYTSIREFLLSERTINMRLESTAIAQASAIYDSQVKSLASLTDEYNKLELEYLNHLKVYESLKKQDTDIKNSKKRSDQDLVKKARNRIKFDEYLRCKNNQQINLEPIQMKRNDQLSEVTNDMESLQIQHSELKTIEAKMQENFESMMKLYQDKITDIDKDFNEYMELNENFNSQLLQLKSEHALVEQELKEKTAKYNEIIEEEETMSANNEAISNLMTMSKKTKR